MSRKQYYLSFKLTGVFLLLGLIVSCGNSSPDLDLPGLRYLDTPLELSEFTLQNHRGQPFTRNSLKGGWSIAFFGYTHCPDICPSTMATMAAVQAQVKKQGLLDTRFLFFSVDPHRDSTEKLQAYLDYFNKDIIGVTGEAAVIQKLATQAGIFYDYSHPQTDEVYRDVTQMPPIENYLVNHGAAIVFFDSRGRLLAHLAPPHDLDKVMQVYQALRRH